MSSETSKSIKSTPTSKTSKISQPVKSTPNPKDLEIPKKPNEPTIAKRASKYTIIGIILTIFNFIIFAILARVFNNNELLWLDSIISYILATFLAYILHSKITWKERPVTKRGIIMFFFWNFLTALIISPSLTWFFGFITPVYEFAYNISQAIHLPFDYDFIESTGIFCFTTLITMILNYIFYDRLVFGKSKNNSKTTPKNPKTKTL